MDVSLARLKLPLPLESAIGRALAQRELAARHEGLVLAWELTVRILAGSLWAVCRHVGADSPALRQATAKLARPSFGNWVELARTAAELLRARRDPAVLPLRCTLDGLDEKIGSEGGLAALRERILEIAPARTRIPGLQSLLDQLPFYRNQAQSTHQQVGADFREASLDALRDGLLEFCERVPPCGEFTLVFVGKLERVGDAGAAEIARLHGRDLAWESRAIPLDAWTALRSSRIYLLHEPALLVPLFPMAAMSTRGADWQVGWYARRVHSPTVAYQGTGGVDFQVALAPQELALLEPEEAGEDPMSTAGTELDPWRGLLAYDEAHASIFLGREEETDAALARIGERGALFVFGASGSGKSSWLRAGILPALRARATISGRALLPIVCVPGAEPARALERALLLARGGSTKQALVWRRAVEEALHGAGASLARGLTALLRALSAEGLLPVLLVDQLEEAALLADTRAREEFLDAVADAARAARSAGAVVLASVRADRLGPLLEHAGVRAALQDEGWALGSIPHERLGRVISEPPRRRRVRVEDGLAEMILSDVGSEPGTLALLSQVLATLWSERARHGGILTKQGYLDAGRVSGALELQAEAALAEADAASAHSERDVDRLFRTLVTSSEGGRFLRRRLGFERVSSALGIELEELRALAQPFVRRHLLVLSGSAGEETIEIAHERLLDGWPRLAKLLAGEGEALELRNEIERAAAAWKASGGKSELWSDTTSKLKRGEELLARGAIDLDELGRAFLVASRKSQERQLRVQHTVLGALAVLAALATAFGWIALLKWYEADREREDAVEAKGRLSGLEQTARRRAEWAGAALRVRRLAEQADELWPAVPRRIPEYERWLNEARQLLEPGRDRPGLATFEADLANLRASSAGGGSELANAGESWWQEQLGQLLVDLHQLADPEQGLASMGSSEAHGWGIPRRLRLARELLRIQQDSDATRLAWEDAEKWLASDPRYREVRLARRDDLLPIGRDPASKLLEFAHLPSGLPAHRNGNGMLEPNEDTGIVLVLLPGGDALLGAQSADPKGPNFDPLELPKGAQHTHKERIPAFLVSKYEMTQAQWARACGRNPSCYGVAKFAKEWNKDGKPPSLLHPVEFLSWDDSVRVLERLGLRLPIENEWEYAARGGKDTPWSTGAKPESLQGAANVADLYGKKSNPDWGDAFEPSIDDGHVVHCEVGSFAPNPFGLYDVHGNVWEWCDSLSRAVGKSVFEPVRGGSFDNPARDARVSAHGNFPRSSAVNTIGLRPACSL